MDLHDAMIKFHLEVGHDCLSFQEKDGRVVSLKSLGVYEEVLVDLKKLLPGYRFTEIRRVEQDAGVWVRVNVEPI